METFGLISTMVHGYKWLNVWHEKQANPPHLPQNAIIAFQRFKEAYDRKNINQLNKIISNSYRGNLYGVSTKQEFVDIQQRVFERLPWGVYPCLKINVYSVVDETSNSFTAIIDTQSLATVLGIPIFSYDSAPVRCQIKSETGLWVISEMFIEQQLLDEIDKSSYAPKSDSQPISNEIDTLGNLGEENLKTKVFFRVQKVISEQLSVEVCEILLESHLSDDLGADDLDLVELVMELEQEFGIEIPDEIAERLLGIRGNTISRSSWLGISSSTPLSFEVGEQCVVRNFVELIYKNLNE